MATKITTPVVALEKNAQILSNRVPNGFNFVITQPTPDEVMLGSLAKKPSFGYLTPNWLYKHIDCKSGETTTRFEYDPAISTKNLVDKWKTQYFYDDRYGRYGHAIIGEEKPNTIAAANGEEPAEEAIRNTQTVIYFDILDDLPDDYDGVEGKICLPLGIQPSQVVIRYDPDKHQLNLVVVTSDTLKYYQFGWETFVAGNPLFIDAAGVTNEITISNWLGFDAISPDGTKMLVYHRDGDYCQLMRLPTGELEAVRFSAHSALFGEHTISWQTADDDVQKITVNCYSGNLVFNLTTGNSEFVKHSIQTVSVQVNNWKFTYSGQKPRTIKGLQWRMPSGVRAQPNRTFVLDSILFKDDYETRFARTNKSIPRGNIGLDASLMFENDFVAVFLIGARSVIGFDKLLEQPPVVYQLADSFKEYTICAITQDRIYAYLIDEDDYEDYGFYGDLNLYSLPYQFANRVAALSRFAKVPEIPFGAARIISGFLAQQKKD